MRPSRFADLAARFEERVIGGVAGRRATAFMRPVDSRAAAPMEAMREVESAIGRPFDRGQLMLSEEEYVRALDFLVRNESRLLDLPYDLSLWRSVEISAWKIGDAVAKTKSEIKWVFGLRPLVVTTLWFLARDEFYHVQAAFGDLRICRLNEKHLKEAKRGIPKL